MNHSSRVKIGLIITNFVFLWLNGDRSLLPVVDGQYETANNHCGGIFRNIEGSIKFKFNSSAGVFKPGEDPNKVCLWTIIPNPMFTKFKINFDLWNLDCNSGNNGNDILSISTFSENTDAITSTESYCNKSTVTSNGHVMVVTLVSKVPKEGNSFTMTWERVEGDTLIPPGNRFVTAFNSYGKTSVYPLPRFTAHFMGNSISTFAFHKGNNTGAYTLQMIFTKVVLEGKICAPTRNECDMLKICAIEPDGRITARRTYKEEEFNLTTPETFKNQYGFFFIMWGGNPSNTSGGGTMELEYSTVRD